MGVPILQSTLSLSYNHIEIYRGEDKEIPFALTQPVKNVDGVFVDTPYDLTGCSLYFSVKHVDTGDVLISKKSTVAGQFDISDTPSDGTATLVIDAADTASLPEIGKYFYDIWLKTAAGKNKPIVKVSEFNVLAGITTI